MARCASSSHRRDPLFPVLLVVAATTFNALLAIVNGNVTTLTAGSVILAEIAIVACALGYATWRFDSRMIPWFALIAGVGLFAVLRMSAVGTFDVKYFRDILLIPTFVLLGMASSERRAIQATLIIGCAVVAGIIIETFSVEIFSNLFQIKEFYISTRGIVFEEFTNKASELYISAIRPDQRYLPYFTPHRLSSIFLEPVSLGNFAIIMASFTIAFWSRLTAPMRLFALFSTGLMLFACDGRLSLLVTLLILVVAAFARLAPRNMAVFILPVVTLVTITMVMVADLHAGPDNLSGRLAYTAGLLGDLQAMDYLGLSNRLLEKSVDSGLVYFIVTQSVVVVAILWLLIVVGLEERAPAITAYKNSLCIYLSLTMMVSYSFVSIKTAAPLWFIYGALAGPGRSAAAAMQGVPGPIGSAAPATTVVQSRT